MDNSNAVNNSISSPVMAVVDSQMAIEYTYAKQHVRPRVRESILSTPELVNRIKNVSIRLNHWMEDADKQFPKSKQLRISKLRRMADPEDGNLDPWFNLLINITVGVALFPYETPLVECLPTMCNGLPFDNKADAVQTLAEMIEQWRQEDFIEIIEVPSTGKGAEFGQTTLALYTNIRFPVEMQESIERLRFLPPMVCEPETITKNNQSGHLTMNRPVLMGGAYHDKQLPLDVINILNKTPMTLDMTFLLNNTQQTEKELDTPEKVEAFDRFVMACNDVYELIHRLSNGNTDKPGAAYIQYGLDSRLRIYAIAYEGNIQGKPFQRCAFDLHELEFIPVPEKYQLEGYLHNALEFADALSPNQQSVPENQESLSAWQYLLCDLATQWGEDKNLFTTRFRMIQAELDKDLSGQGLYDLAEERGYWKEQPLFMKGLQVLDSVRRGEPTGHVIGLDAVCSGMQVSSALTKCAAGCKATGLVIPDQHADAYTSVLREMQRLLPDLADSERQDLKEAVMHSLYGSKATPKELYGEGTEEINAFMQSLDTVCPGAYRLLEVLRHSWQAYARQHQWMLPDGAWAVVPVQAKMEHSIKVQELANRSFKFTYKDIVPTKSGLSLIANVVHSVDGYVMRTLIRRCTHHGHEGARQTEKLQLSATLIQEELLNRELMGGIRKQSDVQPLANPESQVNTEFAKYKSLYIKTKFPDTGMALVLTSRNVQHLSTSHLRALQQALSVTLAHAPFSVLGIHDEFKCSPVHMNFLRNHYREIMAELVEGQVIEHIVRQLRGHSTGSLNMSVTAKKSSELAKAVRASNYGLA